MRKKGDSTVNARTFRMTFLTTREEKEEIERAAAEKGVSRSDYVREKVFGNGKQ